MITSLVLTSVLMYSGVNAYQGIDMSDEEFEQFVDAHYDMFDTVQTFVSDNRHNFETGIIGSLAVAALKPALTSAHPITNLIVIGGSSEVAKNLYKNAVQGKVAKQDEVDELKKQLAEVIKELNQLKASGNYGIYPTAGDFTAGYAHDPKAGAHDVRSSMYSINGRSFTTDARNAGPHRHEYRSYRDPSTRDIKDIIDHVYHDSVNPRDNYVEK